jgi:hypothetical protein
MTHQSDTPATEQAVKAVPADYNGTCLRPLGLCELGGCCEVCWYRPDHPRFRERKEATGRS